MELLGKLIALSLTSVLCCAVLRRGAPEFSLLLTLCAGACILQLTLGPIQEILAAARRLAGLAQLEESLLTPLWKTVCLSVLTRMTAELCRGAGEQGTAAFVETAGTVLALAEALPLCVQVLDLTAELLA